jgi:hypothetical protein
MKVEEFIKLEKVENDSFLDYGMYFFGKIRHLVIFYTNEHERFLQFTNPERIRKNYIILVSSLIE